MERNYDNDFSLDIDFNHPLILRGFINQALPQVGLENFSERIVVGRDGGLAYKLFNQPFSMPNVLQIYTKLQMKESIDYFDAIDRYLARADGCASEYGFGLVKFSNKNEIIDGFNSNDTLFDAGIGSARIGSVECFSSFLNMINSGKDDLEKLHEELIEKAKVVKRS